MGIGAVPLDRFRFLLVQRRQFGSGVAADPQQFIELGMDCLGITMLGPLDQQRHQQCRDGGGAGPAEACGIKDQPSQGEGADNNEG